MDSILSATSGTIVAVAFAVLVLFLVSYLHGSARAKRNAAGIRVLEAELGLRRVGEQAWVGAREGFDVDISVAPKLSKEDRVDRTRVRVGGALPANVSLGKAGVFAKLTGRGLAEVYGGDIRVGDAPFDAAIVVKGQRDEVFALLDDALREQVAAAVGEGWILVERRWQFTSLEGPVPADFERVRRGLALAAAVQSRADAVLPRLVERAMNDPSEGVRAGALDVLLRLYRDAPESARAFEHAQRFDVPAQRLAVSRGLDDRSDLITFVGADLPLALRVAALEVLVAGHAQHPEVRALCVQALEGPPELRLVAVSALDGTPGGLAVAEADGALALAEDDVIPVP